ncbi:LANO_0B01992g1_1 [Lachancea nothofagi CBS 11611]|uniref:Vacuolar-sorting protein SNF8 n=1 Tax=Lachancea nothofagi CBS 11611 TaxID=1266666 RepID=A0A1G4IVP1_9SACH|nr:LANO_0B01992g1_1 [Lachancea nothofagi CBS 11611]
MKHGLAAFNVDRSERYEITASLLSKQNKELDDQLSIFQDRLIEFAKDHNAELKENPDFRMKFIKMCTSIGIDPICLFDKERHLFDVNDFFYEICVKVIELCRKTKDLNGGVISFDELHKGYFEKFKVEMNDLQRAVEMLEVLDGGFEVFTIKDKKYLRSVPNELTNDQTKILEVCSILGYASTSLLKLNLDWKPVRSDAVLKEMVANGILWVDIQAPGETLYWDPAWIARSDFFRMSL